MYKRQQLLSRRIRFENASQVAPHQFAVLCKVLKGATTPGELAEQEKVSAPSMSRTVNSLVEAGYLDREAHPTDGRQRVLTLTKSGQAVVERTIHDRDDWMIHRLQRLSADDRAVLARAVIILEEVLAQ